jgi:hypothetical protein
MRYPLYGLTGADGLVNSLNEFQVSLGEIAGITGLGTSGNILTDQGNSTALFAPPAVSIDVDFVTASAAVTGRVEIDLEFKETFGGGNTYSEITRTSGDISQIDIWQTSAKTHKLFTKEITRTSGNITSVSLVDEKITMRLLTNITRLSGNIDTITKTYGPAPEVPQQP